MREDELDIQLVIHNPNHAWTCKVLMGRFPLPVEDPRREEGEVTSVRKERGFLGVS